MSKNKAREAILIPKSEIGVVIQGPIQSYGRILTDLSKRKFDCSADVKSMLQSVQEAGALPVVATWANQDLDLFTDAEKSCFVLSEFPRANVKMRLVNDWTKNSKYRQYFSTLAGVEYLKKMKCNYVIKIRSDNLVDLKNLIEFVSGLDKEEANKYFYCPLVNLDKPHMFYDFYSFSSLKKIEDFCNVMLFEKELTTNIHFDVFYRWTKHQMQLRRRLKDITLVYPSYPKFTQTQLNLVRLGLSEVFRPLPRITWTTLYWRGEQLGEQGVKPQYRFSNSSTSQILSDFDYFQYKRANGLNINWLSVPSFFVSSRVEIHLNKLKSKIGGLSRRLLKRSRKILDS
jgi:hypothetical protein